MMQQKLKSHAKSLRTSVALLAMFVSPFPQAAMANPSTRAPMEPLDTHGTIAGAAELAASCYAVCRRVQTIVDKMQEQQTDPRKLSGQELRASAGQLWKGIRDAKHLKLMGETAGYDVEPQLIRLSQAISRFSSMYIGTDEGQKLRQKLTVKLTRGVPQLVKGLQSAEKTLASGNHEGFNQQIESIGIELMSDFNFFYSEETPPFRANFYDVQAKGDGEVSKARTVQYLGEVKRAIEKQLAASKAFPASAAKITDQFKQGTTATLADGKSLSTAEAMDHIVSSWEVASVGIIRAQAIEATFGGSPDSLGEEMSTLKSSATSSVISLIDAAAASTTTENVRQLHSDLMEHLSIVHRRMGSGTSGREWVTACGASLDKLVAKDPAYPAQIAAYRKAVSEPLAWRKLYASEKAALILATLPPARSLLIEKSVPTPKLRPKGTTPFSTATTIAPSSLSDPSHWMIDETSSRLVGKYISEDKMLRLSPTTKVGMVPFDGLHYAAVVLPIPTEAETAELRRLLLTTDTHRPLTFDAVNAISAATMGDYAGVGGEIKAVTMEATSTRLITLPDVAYLLAPLGELPPMPEHGQMPAAVCWRLDIQPTWAHPTYFNYQAK